MSAKEPIKPSFVSAYTLTCAAGAGLEAVRQRIASGISGLSSARWPGCDFSTWFGRVKELDQVRNDLPDRWNSRNNLLARLGLEFDEFAHCVSKAKQRYGAHRCATIIGTSTSSIGRTEEGYHHLDADRRFPESYRQPDVHNPHSPSIFVADYLGLEGPCMTASAACASSAKVFASAARWLESGIADAVVVGGVDSLCLSIIYGFHSLQLVSDEPCRPFDKARSGISLGEAAGYALITREPVGDKEIVLLGYGESSDAYHMSSAHPEGRGAKAAMQAALDRSGLAAAQIDYMNLHGTGTRSNDAIEGLACQDLIAGGTIFSATKGWTGHTLGAAGIVESVLCMTALESGQIPGTINTRDPVTEIGPAIALETRNHTIGVAMTNSFGFGGNNCSLIFGRAG